MRHLAVVLSLLLAPILVSPAAAAPRVDRSRAAGTLLDGGYWANYARVPGRIATAPLDWSRQDWAIAAAAGLGAGLVFALDEPIHHRAQDLRGGFIDDVSDFARRFGETDVLLGLTAGGYLAGTALGSPRLAGTSLVALQALLLTAVTVEGLKLTTHRDRPNASDSAYDFHGLSGDGDSFVSGHAAGAFAVATVFAREFDEQPWLAPTLYGLATLTALSRINDDKHWATDVLVGGAIGYGIGRMAQKLSLFKRDLVDVMPFRAGDATGVRARMKF